MYKITAKLTSKSLLKKGNSEHGDWFMVTFIVEKQHRKKKRKFAFIAYNDVAKKIITLPKNERITVRFTPDCKEYKGKWYVNLRVTEVKKWVSKRNTRESMVIGADPLPKNDYTVIDNRPLFDNIDGGNESV